MKSQTRLFTAFGTCAALAIAGSPRVLGADSYADSSPLALGEERISADETKVIEQLVKIQSLVQQGMIKARGKPLRGQHGKTHGCVEAELNVLEDLPESVRHGLFAEVATYRATLRFSNGKNLDDDREPDVHGLAIKVHAVQGPKALEQGPDEQDFVLIDSPEFFAPDAASVLALMQAKVAAAQGNQEVLAELVKTNPELLQRAQASLKSDLPSPLASSYWSTVPYRLGEGAAKYLVHPAESNTLSAAQRDNPDYLRQAMARQLADGPARFDLLVQVQQDSTAQPIEDPTVPWQVEEIKVASLTIPKQQFDSQKQLNRCNTLVFSPWHATASQAPLGGVNRARRAVYEASAAIRKVARVSVHPLGAKKQIRRHWQASSPIPATITRGLSQVAKAL